MVPGDPRAGPPTQGPAYYHLLAENSENEYIAYVSEQNLLPDETGEPIRHPQVGEMFGALAGDRYTPRRERQH